MQRNKYIKNLIDTNALIEEVENFFSGKTIAVGQNTKKKFIYDNISLKDEREITGSYYPIKINLRFGLEEFHLDIIFSDFNVSCGYGGKNIDGYPTKEFQNLVENDLTTAYYKMMLDANEKTDYAQQLKNYLGGKFRIANLLMKEYNDKKHINGIYKAVYELKQQINELNKYSPEFKNAKYSPEIIRAMQEWSNNLDQGR